MAYQRRILSDREAVSLGTSASVLVGGFSSNELDIWNYNEVDFFVKIENKGLATEVSLTVEFSNSLPSNSSDWAPLTTENISSGIATQNIYSANFNLADFSNEFTLGINIPARGRYMRLRLTPNATLSGVSISAIRRA